MKKYILFAGSNYYPLGGCSDIQYDHDTIDLLKEYYQDFTPIKQWGWGHILNIETKEIIYL